MEVLRFPPVMSRAHIERHGYLKSFPQSARLRLRAARQRAGDPRGRRAAITTAAIGPTSLAPNDLVLTPAACYPVYPIVGEPRSGAGEAACSSTSLPIASAASPPRIIDRLQSFRMREYVCIGTPDQITEFRERWIVRGQGDRRSAGPALPIEQANDPFFGRTGKIDGDQPVRSSASNSSC